MKPLSLTLFFTNNVSLQEWARIGMLTREVAIYQRLQAHGIQINFVTYGDKKDLELADKIPGIRILCNQWGLPLRFYKRLIPLLHGPWLATSHIYKTNQINGGQIALRAARFWHKPLIARCGYMWSLNAGREFGNDSSQENTALSIENAVFSASSHIIVTTEAMAQLILQRSLHTPKNIHIIPNYVDTVRFAPQQLPQDIDLLFVGRLQSEKNLQNLLIAIQSLNVKIMLIGGGTLRNSLEQRFKDNQNIIWQGNVPNVELPQYLNRAKIFILPSHYEGHPKTLIEAMSCGLPVIGTNVSGIREQLQDGVTGILCETNPESIRNAIQKLMGDESLRQRLGRNARQHILDHLSLDRIVDMELDVLRKVIQNHRLNVSV